MPQFWRTHAAWHGVRWRALKPLVLLAILLNTATAQFASEYQVKAAFLFNFAKFVEWPADAFTSADAPLQICVLGQDPFGNEFEAIENKRVSGRRLEVVHPSGVPQAKACQIYSWLLRKSSACERSCAV